MNCLLRRIELTVACGGVFIFSQGNPRARRCPRPSTSTYSSVRPIAGITDYYAGEIDSFGK